MTVGKPLLSNAANRRQQRSSRGFTLIEVMVGLAALMIAILAFASTTLVVHSVNESDRERRLAVSGLRAAVERLGARSAGAMELDDLWPSTITDAYQAGGDPGPVFDVPGLEPWDGQANIGSVEIIVDETRADADIGADVGMPRDLDMDGLALSADVSDTAVLLPVVVRVRWNGAGGARELVQGFWIARM